MNQVSEILGDKGRDVLKIDAEASALDAVRQMVGANIGSLLVTDGDEVTGIVTERTTSGGLRRKDRPTRT
jgi:CBS domain-containing protein